MCADKEVNFIKYRHPPEQLRLIPVVVLTAAIEKLQFLYFRSTSCVDSGPQKTELKENLWDLIVDLQGCLNGEFE